MTDVPFDITPVELARRLRSENAPLLLDVRTSRELRIASLPGSVHIPLHLLPARLQQLDRGREIVVLCHLGGRSSFAVELLRAAGFAAARNLAGGIDRWSAEIDPAVPRY
jgi:rhodanese-related sulfurtransferase